MKYRYLLASVFAVTICLFPSCEDGDETIALELSSSIPSDASADESPSVDRSTVTIPNLHFQDEDYQGETVVRLDMTGLWDKNNQEWMYLYGTGSSKQNIWLELDGSPKGFLVHNTIDDQDKDHVAQADLVFLVDNSGTMDQEADAVARDIAEWAELLDNSGTDIEFACVGYQYGNINGAIDFTDASSLSSFLNYGTGPSRTSHFGGSHSSSLQSYARNFYQVSGECGGMALRFADAYLNFRSGANRIYVNFTDEPNQPNYYSYYSTESFNTNWSSQQGAVHTVYSSTDTLKYGERINYAEKPWRISWYTGGTVLFADPYFTDVDLNKLPVTGAIQNSYILRFVINNSLRDGYYHNLVVTVKSKDEQIQARRSYSINFGTLED